MVNFSNHTIEKMIQLGPSLPGKDSGERELFVVVKDKVYLKKFIGIDKQAVLIANKEMKWSRK